MRYPHFGKLFTLLGALLALGLSSPLLAESRLDTQNDGNGITAYAHSSDDVLSMSIRIVGPDGFVFEDRVEDSAIDWTPEGDLSDGLYSWEARMVTVSPGAPPREDPALYTSKAPMPNNGNQGNQGAALEGAEQDSEKQADNQIPLERFFSDEHKKVTRKSGSFRVSDGWIEPINPDETASVRGSSFDGTPETSKGSGVLASVAETIIDFVFPSAHAQQTFIQNVEIDKTNPTLIFTTGADFSTVWTNFVFSQEWTVRYTDDNITGTVTPVTFTKDSPEDSLVLTSSGNIGLGTGAPDSDLHISDVTPVIHLEDTSDSQSWYVKNTNAGRFEIGEVRAGTPNPNPFTIEPGAPDSAFFVASNGNVGVGTSDPGAGLGTSPTLDIQGSTFVGLRVGEFAWTNDSSSSFFRGLSGQGIVQIFGNAPGASLHIADNGDIGLSTTNPQAPLHVVRDDNSAQVLVQDTGVGNQSMFSLVNQGAPIFDMEDAAQSNVKWEFAVSGTEGDNERFQISKVGSGQLEFRVNADGSAQFAGDVTANGVLLTSTREAKTDFEPLDENDVLNKLASLEISKWRYKTEPDSTRHVGPIAEEFHEVFGLSDGKTLNMIDTNGITFAAIQALNAENKKLAKENQALQARLERLEDAIDL